MVQRTKIISSAGPVGVAAAALCSLAALVMLCVLNFTSQSHFLLDQQADIRAVGDEGCLGRSCKMSDAAAAKDLDHFFKNFLDKGPHAGRKTAHIKNLEQHRAKTVKLTDSDAGADLDRYYDNLPAAKTDRVQNSEAKSEYLPLLADKESRKDLDAYYDNLKTGPGRKAKILEAEMNAKREALHLHLDGIAKRKLEEKRMLQIEARSVMEARKDKKRFAETEAAEQSAQDRGHSMEAVPSAKQSAKEARKEALQYFDSLQNGVHKTKTVVHSESAAEAQAHTDMALASDRHSILSAKNEPSKKAGWLSEKDDKAQQDEFFNSLQQAVHKTPEVLRAEAEAEKQARRDMHQAAVSSESKTHLSKSVHALSRREAEEDQEDYFKALNAQVHKTPRVLRAEARARALAAKHKAAINVDDSVAERAAERAAPAVVGGRLSAKAAREQLSSAIDAYPVNKRPHHNVKPAVGDAPLSSDKAREQLDQAIDAFAVHKTPAVLRAEAAAEAEAAADRAESAAETRSSVAVAAPRHARLSAANAAAQQERYFESLQAKVHKTAAVLRAEVSAKAAAKAALSGAAGKPAVEDVHTEPAGPVRLSAGQAQAQQDRYFESLSRQVHKTRAVLRSEKLAAAAAARALHAAAARARLELDSAVDSLPARKAPLPHVAPAVGDVRLSAEAARRELDSAIDALPVHKTSTVLRAEAAARADAAALAREHEEVSVRSTVVPSASGRLSAEEARAQLDDDAVSDAKPAVGDARLTAAEARAEMRKAIDALPVHKTASVVRAEAAAMRDQAKRARFLAEERAAVAPAAVAAVPSRQLTAKEARAQLDQAIDALPTHKVAPRKVKPAVGDARMTAAEARAELQRDVDALPAHKTASVVRSEAAAVAAATADRQAARAATPALAAPAPLDARLSAAQAHEQLDAAIDALPHNKVPLPHVQPAVGDRRLSAEEARKEMDADVDALPHEKKTLPRNVQPAVSGARLSAEEARKDMNAAMDALPHEKKALPHVEPAVSGARLSAEEARRQMNAAMDALPHAKGPLPHGEAAVPAGRLAAGAARRDMDGFFDTLPLPHHALPRVAPAVGDARLPSAAARRALVQDLARLKHS